jgi:hypothetical protein
MFIVFRYVLIGTLLIFNFALGYSKDNCEVVRYVTCCEISNERLLRTDTIVIQINDRSGEVYTDELKIYYSNDNPITDFSAWIEDKNGQMVRTLKKKETTEANTVSSIFYSDNFTRSFTLKYTDYPYRICYTYKLNYKHFLYVADWNPVVLDIRIPTRAAKLIIRQPENYPVKIMQRNISEPEKSMEAGVITRVWKSSYDGNLDDEQYSIDWAFFLPNVKVVPEQFDYVEKGSFASWQQFGEWQQKLIDGLDKLPETEKAVVEQIVGETYDKREIVRTLYHFLQDHTRYINVSINIGGMKPYPASYVAQNHYGDCKALTIYMKALLKAAGIQSFYVLVNAGYASQLIDIDFPSQQFNHVILAVPLDNDTLWLENTSNINPFGYINTFIQNRPGLLINGLGSKLVRIPALTDQQAREYSFMSFILNDNGTAAVYANIVLGGYSFDYINAKIALSNMESQNDYVHDYLPFTSFELIDWKMIKGNRDACSLVLNANLDVQHLSRKMGNDYYFSCLPLNFPAFESPSKRKLKVNLPFPVHKTDTLIYQLPEGRKVISDLPLQEISSPFGHYKIGAELRGQCVYIYRDFQLFSGLIPIEQYTNFYKFLAQIKEEEKNKILFR